jgi:hypothetical protein
MQMVFMTFRSSLEDEVLKWLEAERVSFTFVEKAHGKGVTGLAPSSIYWGGSNTVLFVGIQDEQLNGFRERIYNLQRKFRGEGEVPVPYPVPFHVFVLPCIQWFWRLVQSSIPHRAPMTRSRIRLWRSRSEVTE